MASDFSIFKPVYDILLKCLMTIYCRIRHHEVDKSYWYFIHTLLFVAVKCAGVNLTDIMDRFGVDLVRPNLPSNYDDEFNFNDVVEFNCTIPGKGLEMRSQQCVLDETFGGYRLVGDSLECKRKNVMNLVFIILIWFILLEAVLNILRFTSYTCCLFRVYFHKEYFVVGIDCGPVPVITGLNRDGITEAETFYEDSFMFECDTTLTRYGSSSNGNTVQCMNNTHWDLGDLRCEGRKTS